MADSTLNTSGYKFCHVPRTNVQCWGKYNKKQCIGEIDAGIDLENSRILWLCAECGDRGSISNWENTFWDCGHC